MGGLMGTLRTWGDRASFEADKFMRANRVRSDITRIKKEIEAAYAQIGHTVVEMHQTGRLPDSTVIDQAVGHIHQLERELQEKDAEALTIQGEKWEEPVAQQPQVIEGQRSPQPFPNTYGGPPVAPATPYALPTGSYGQQQPPQSYQQPAQSYQQPAQSYQPPAQEQHYEQPPQSYQQPAVTPTAPPPTPPTSPPAPATSVSDAMTQAMPIRHCAKCGAELRPNARFCPVCGTPAPLG